MQNLIKENGNPMGRTINKGDNRSVREILFMYFGKGIEFGGLRVLVYKKSRVVFKEIKEVSRVLNNSLKSRLKPVKR